MDRGNGIIVGLTNNGRNGRERESFNDFVGVGRHFDEEGGTEGRRGCMVFLREVVTTDNTNDIGRVPFGL